MSRPMRRGLAGFALVAILLLVFGPPLLAGRVQQAYRGLLGETVQAMPNGRLISERYVRGWFGSEASAELVLQPGPEGAPTGDPVQVRLDSRIQQGPAAWFAGRLPPALALVHSRVELGGLPVAVPPLLVTTEIGVEGGGVARLRVPAFEGTIENSGYRLRNAEMTGEMDFGRNLDRFTLALALPSLELISSAGAPVGRLEGAALQAQAKRGADGLYAGTSRLAVASAVFGEASGGAETALERLTVELAQTSADGLLGVRMDFAADRLQGGGSSYRAARLAINAERLDMEALAELGQGLNALNSGAIPESMRGIMAAALMARILPKIAAPGPRVALDPLHVETPDGAVAGRTTLVLQDAAGGGGPVAWITALRGDGELEVPEAVAVEFARHGLGGGRAGVSDERARGALQGWIRDGWVTARDGRIATAFQIADGQVSINGKSLPLLSQVLR